MSSSVINQKLSPMMVQWHECKKKATGALLLFRLGDFYEAFYEDAALVARELDITLTKRQEIPMSGIPYHTSEMYIDRLVAKGYRVAIAEQLENAKDVKGLVPRDIVRFITPGTLIESTLLKEKSNNYFISVYPLNETFGIAILDLSTGECRVEEIEEKQALIDELFKLKPSEVLTSEKCAKHFSPLFDELRHQFPFALNSKPEYFFDHRSSYQALLNHFSLHSLDHFGLKGRVAAINATGALFNYLKNELQIPLNHVHALEWDTALSGMLIDRTTEKNLELLSSGKEHSPSFLSLIDQTLTPMGGRLLKNWLSRPLTDVTKIQNRQESIQALLNDKSLASLLRQVRDLERIAMRIETGYASCRDFLLLKTSLEQIPPLQSALPGVLNPLGKELVDLGDVVEEIEKALMDDPPLRLHEGGIFKKGYSLELDALRDLSCGHLNWINTYQKELREKTGIKNLKVSFTKAFGYYIEVSRIHSQKIPDEFERKQTLVNNERFTTSLLKEYEHKILHAEEKSALLEKALFEAFRKKIALKSVHLRKNGKILAEIDCLHSLATLALKNHYTRPVVDDSDLLMIYEGRHPVVETLLPKGSFTPNDTFLGEERLALITGPNMAGKSTYIRQVALIVILAQIGSFVPAKKAHIGVIDKLFSRIGASDDLSRGQSTFMVEMSETAYILHHATHKSLIILDEIGRGTSTYDGISIAWSVAEYLVSDRTKRAKTLFATHYFELTDLSVKFKDIVNYHVAVEEAGSDVVFLHKIVSGVASKSYGIHVAKLAGLPSSVIKKAQEILSGLEKRNKNKSSKVEQLLLFQTHSLSSAETLLSELKEIDIHALTPLKAQQQLAEFIQRAHEF